MGFGPGDGLFGIGVFAVVKEAVVGEGGVELRAGVDRAVDAAKA